MSESNGANGKPKKRYRHVSDAKREAFLERLREHGSATRAAVETGISRAHLYSDRKLDPKFAEEWVDAKEMGIDSWEDELARRGFHGRQVPKTVAGERVDVTEFDTTAGIFMLKGERREKFADRQEVRHSGELESTFRVAGLTPEQARLKLLEELKPLLDAQGIVIDIPAQPPRLEHSDE